MTTELEPIRATPLTLIEMAIQKGMSPKDLGDLYALQERHERNEAAKGFALAIAEFQERMPAVEKRNPVFGKNRDLGPQYYFADYAEIMETAQPILNECGIAVTFDSESSQGSVRVTCRVRVGIHQESTSFALPMPTIPNANPSQIAGAALSYAKRYALCAALNIRVKGEDQDAGNLDQGISTEQVRELNELFEACRKVNKPVDSDRFLAIHRLYLDE